MTARNRIVEVLDVPGSLVRVNPANWRTHPQEQLDALSGSLNTVGVVDVLKVVPHPSEPGAYLLVDGHARAELLGPDAVVKVAVLDLTPDEQRLVLATFDPLTQMSGTDRLTLDKLLVGLSSDDAALQGLLDDMWSFGLDESLKAGEGTPEPELKERTRSKKAQDTVGGGGGGVFGDVGGTTTGGQHHVGKCPTCGREYDVEY